ncbi:hypothetical protein DFJ73DRAFT_50524 [Zopfochytrium polystomum]|nr:hypothetical protein DFJ73DRAFT_50524 [Zopfochytrium polystomum]
MTEVGAAGGNLLVSMGTNGNPGINLSASGTAGQYAMGSGSGIFGEQGQDQAYTSGPQGKPQRVASMSIGQSLFQKLIRRGGSKVDRSDRPEKGNARQQLQQQDLVLSPYANPGAPVVSSLSRPQPKRYPSQEDMNYSLNRSSPSGQDQDPNRSTLNVLRIYAGNVDLKATFKTVSLTKTMTANELLEQTLRRFRASGSASEYYLSVIHMDSLERRLPETENVYDALEKLRNKHLPGVGFNSLSRSGGSTRAASILINDDNFIKIIVNKKLNLFEKNFHLVRIFMYDEFDPSMRTYKTIGVSSEATVNEILDIAVKKFKVPPQGFRYTLTSVFKGSEILRQRSEKMVDILRMASGSSEDIDFILGKEPSGSFSEQDSRVPVDEDTVARSKAMFSQEAVLSPEESPDVNSGVTTPLSQPSTLHRDGPVRAWSGGASTQLGPNSADANNAFVASVHNGKQQQQNWQPLTPPEDNTTLIRPSNVSRSPTPDMKFPPRKGSLVTSGPVRSLVGPDGRTLDQTALEDAVYRAQQDAMGQNRPQQGPGRTISPDPFWFDNKPLPLPPMGSTPPPSNELKQNFGAMEEYLQEIMKDQVDLSRLEVLEGALRKGGSPIPTQSGRKASDAGIGSLSRTGSPSVASSTLRSQNSLKEIYDDLERDLETLAVASSRAPQSILSRFSTVPAVPTPPDTPGSTPTPPPGGNASPFNLPESTKSTSGPAPSSKYGASVGSDHDHSRSLPSPFSSLARSAPSPMDLISSSQDAAIQQQLQQAPTPPAHRRRSRAQSTLMETSVAASSGTQQAAAPRKSSLIQRSLPGAGSMPTVSRRKESLPTAVGGGVVGAMAAAAAAVAAKSAPQSSSSTSSVDVERALESFKDTELVLTTLQKDLDSICARACALLKAPLPTPPV